MFDTSGEKCTLEYWDPNIIIKIFFFLMFFCETQVELDRFFFVFF